MGRALSGDQAAALTQGLPLIWNASLIWLRCVQLARLAEGISMGTTWWGQKGPIVPAIAQRMGDAVGIIRLDTWKGYPRPLVRCLRCEKPVWRLLLQDGAWACRWCWTGGKDAPVHGTVGGHCTTFTRTEILLGDYACGVRIGLTGQAMMQRRGFLLKRLRTRHLAHGKGPLDLWLLGVGGALLGPKPIWTRLGYKRGFAKTLSPLWPRLAAHICPVAVETLLHPDAYRMRFGGSAWH